MNPNQIPYHKLLYYLVLASLVWLQSGCSRPSLEQQESFVFGTRVEVLVASEQPVVAKAAISKVLREFDRLHRQYHAWKPSELTALNADIAKGKPHQVTPELASLIGEAQELSKQGGFLFDPGIGNLISLWGFQADEFKSQLPDEAELYRWKKSHPSIGDLRIDEHNVVRSKNKLVSLDFGGYLKGWALDRATEILRQDGIQNALINIGGNIMAMGSKFGKPWVVGIQNPRPPGGALASVELQDGEAIGTSGDYQRFFEWQGQRYPHILDPRTAFPVNHTQAVTVLIPRGPRAGTLSDASSKPIFIAGPTAWRTTVGTLGIAAVLRVDADGRIQATQAMAQRLKKTSNSLPVVTEF
jgi:thiamine biosynthesis lipoprotein